MDQSGRHPRKERNKKDLPPILKPLSSRIKIKSKEEYCELLKQEFSFEPEKLLRFSQESAESSSDEDETESSEIYEMQPQKSPFKTISSNLKPIADRLDSLSNYLQPMSPTTPRLQPATPHDVEQAFSHRDPNKPKSGQVQDFIQKKNVAQGMMDLALVAANCNQLRYVLDMSAVHPYFLISLILIITSLVLQVIVGLVLLYSNSYNLKHKTQMKSADKFNNFGIYGVFLITLTNFLISAFSGANLGAEINVSEAPPQT